MDDDFKPAKRPAKSLQAKLNGVPTRQTTNTESFQTPGEVAAADDVTQPAELMATTPETGAAGEATKSWRDKLKFSWPPGQREWLASVIIVVVCGSITGLILTHIGSKPVVSAVKPVIKVKPAAPKPTTVASTLSGLQVDPTVNARPVTGVMIENSTDARPQAGLSQASVVFEAIAEGGITRFLALFQDTAPDNVGPIRSARPYYLQWVLGFNAGYAHVGGSPEALADIKAWGVRDLDQFANGGSYHRVSTRAAPHNVYTAISTLNQLEVAKGYTTSTFTGFKRKAKEQPTKVPTAKSLGFSISGPVYSVHYDYTVATNSYNRFEGGASHIDANTNTQISPKVVIAMVMPYSLEADGYHSDYSTIGSGPVYVFQDGTVTTGQWTKSAATSQFTFTDAAGKPLGLNPGQTWLTAVSDSSKVSYTP